MESLTLVHKDADGATIEFWNLHDGPTTVGRGSESNAKVEDDQLSRKHFVVTREAGGFTPKDLESTNSTIVNGQRVTGHLLRPNDEIRAGQVAGQNRGVDGRAQAEVGGHGKYFPVHGGRL